MATTQKDETKAADTAKKAEKLDAKKIYTLVGTGAGKVKGKAFLAKGVEFQVYGSDAQHIINAGRATLKG